MRGDDKHPVGHDDSRRAAPGTVGATPSAPSEPVERQLRRQVALCRCLYGMVPAGVIVVDEAGRIVEANDRAQDVLGYSRETIVGTTAADPRWAATREDGSPFPVDEHPLTVALRTRRQVDDVVAGVRRAGGQLRWLLVSARPAMDPDSGVVLGAVSTFMDITERRQAQDFQQQALEKALWESDERFQRIFEEGSLGVALVNRDLQFTLVNPRICQITGYTEDELLGRTVIGITYPADIPETTDLYEQLFRGDIPSYRIDKRYVRKDGEIVWVNLTATSVRGQDGSLLYSLTILQDITDRERAEEEHEREMREVAAARLRIGQVETVIASTVDGVFVCDKDGRITEVNGAMRRLFGLLDNVQVDQPAGEYLRALDLRHPDGRPIAPDELALNRALRGELVRGYEELARRTTDGQEADLLVSASPIRDQNGDVVGAVEVMTDITRVRELSKLKEQFVAIAAHELKTPVTIVKGYAQALLRSYEMPEPVQKKMLDAIVRGSGRIDGIVRELLDITRLREGRLSLSVERVDLAALVTETVASVALTTVKHRLIMTRLDAAKVRGDRQRLESVFVNLLNNAIKFSPNGGDVEIAVERKPNEAIVSIADHGVGIPKSKQGNIFQQFYSAHTGTPYDFGGMAVGLYISREIVGRHGGRLWFQSEEGRGSTFYVALPLARDDGEVPE